MKSSGGIFELLAKRMAWLGRRQSLVAKNIANADTPGFVPRDLSESRFRAFLSQPSARLGPVASHEGHIAPAARRMPAGGGEAAAEPATAEPYEAAPCGNAVVLEQELIKMNQVQADHAMIVNLYRKNMEFMRLVLQSRR